MCLETRVCAWVKGFVLRNKGFLGGRLVDFTEIEDCVGLFRFYGSVEIWFFVGVFFFYSHDGGGFGFGGVAVCCAIGFFALVHPMGSGKSTQIGDPRT